MMARIRSKNTRPELIVFAALTRRGVKFRRHFQNAPGHPDIARPRRKLAVFIDGDFWHGRELRRMLEKHGADSPWVKKLERNMTRDVQQEQQLRDNGWDVLRVWASDILRAATREKTIDAIEAFLRSRN